MVSAAVTEEFERALEFTPVEGCSNDYVIHAKTHHRNGSAEREMTSADWDKFEKDIADAFEQVP